MLLTRRSTLIGFAGVALAGCAAPLEATTVRGQARPTPEPRNTPSSPTQPTPTQPAPSPRATERTSAPSDERAPLRLAVPARDPHAETGSAFFERTCELDRIPFEDAIFGAIASGNVPSFERAFAELHLSAESAEGERHQAVLYVLRDYLAIGADDDFLRIPMTPMTAQRIATLTGCVLPTTKLVDEIYRQARVRLPPCFIEGGPSYENHHLDYVTHNRGLEAHRLRSGYRLGDLTAGDKKDIVISNRLVSHPHRVAIYGWHRRVDDPIQPLSTIHNCKYADYSHGVRLISARMTLDGDERRLDDVLRDDRLCPLVSDEGPLEIVAYSTDEPPSDPASKHARPKRHARR